MYHEFKWYMIAHFPFLDLVYECTTDGLNEDQDIDGHTYTMMWICQTPAWADSEVAEDEDNGGENDREDLEGDVYSKCQSRVFVVEAGNEDGDWYNAEEGDGSNHSMSCNYRMVLLQCAEAVAHTCTLN